MTDEKPPVEIDYTDEEEAPIDAFDDSDPDEETEQETVELEAEKGEEVAEPPAAEPEKEKAEDEGASVPLTALKDERSKRQSLEEELATAKQEIAKHTQRSGDVPDPEADPIGYQEFMKDEAKVKVMNDRITMSAQIMSETKDDYKEMEVVFLIWLTVTLSFLTQ